MVIRAVAPAIRASSELKRKRPWLYSISTCARVTGGQPGAYAKVPSTAVALALTIGQ